MYLILLKLKNNKLFKGNVASNGGDFSTGMKHISPASGTHEESPYEGVLIGSDLLGTPNMVEANETVYNNYVFSNRLTIPEIKKPLNGEEYQQYERILRKYKGKTYSEAAKAAEKDSGVNERPRDPIARRGFENTLNILALSLELQRDAYKYKNEADKINSVSPMDYYMQKLQQELQQMQELAMLLQMQALQMGQQLNPLQGNPNILLQPSPDQMQLMLMQMQSLMLPLMELNLVTPELMQQMQLMQQAPLMSYGGRMYATDGNMYGLSIYNPIYNTQYACGGKLNRFDLGGQLTPDLVMAMLQMQGGQSQVPGQELPIPLLYALMPLQIDLSQIDPSMMQGSPEIDPSQVQEGDNQSMNEGNDVSELLEELELDTEADDMSTKELDNIIDVIIDYALLILDEDLLSEANEVKKGKRKDKVEFVDEARNFIYELLEAEGDQIPYEEMQGLNMPVDLMDLMSLDLQYTPDLIALMQVPELLQGLVMNPNMMDLQAIQGLMLELINPSIMQGQYAYGGSFNNVNRFDYGGDTTNAKAICNYILHLYGKDLRLKLFDKSNGATAMTNMLQIALGLIDRGVPINAITAVMYNMGLESGFDYSKTNNGHTGLLLWSAKRFGKTGNDLNSLLDLVAKELNSRKYKGLITDDEHTTFLNLTNKYVAPESKYANSRINNYITNAGRWVESLDAEGRNQITLATNYTPYTDNTDYINQVNTYKYNRFNPNDMTLYSDDVNSAEHSTWVKGNRQLGYWNGNNFIPVESFITPKSDGNSVNTFKTVTDYFKANPNITALDIENNKAYNQETLLILKDLYNPLNRLQALDYFNALNEVTKGTNGQLRYNFDETNPMANTIGVGENYNININDLNENNLQEFIKLIREYNKNNKGKRLSNINKFIEGRYDGVLGPHHLSYYTPNSQILYQIAGLDGYLNTSKYDPEALLELLSEYYELTDPLQRLDKNGNPIQGSKFITLIPRTDKTLGKGNGSEGNGEGFPEMKWYENAMGPMILGAALAYNALSPTDYSNADALLLSAGRLNPTHVLYNPIGNYVLYRPIDTDYLANMIAAKGNATDRNIMNMANGNRGTAMAGLLSSGYNTLLALALAYLLALLSNTDLRFKVEEFNRGTNLTNSLGMLLADMANQSADNNMAALRFEALAKAYAMRLNIKDDKLKAINANLSGIATGINNMFNQRVLNRMINWTLNNNPNNIALLDSYLEKQKKTLEKQLLLQKRNSSKYGGKFKTKKQLLAENEWLYKALGGFLGTGFIR